MKGIRPVLMGLIRRILMSNQQRDRKKAIPVRFQVNQGERLWRAGALGHAIHTQGRTLEELHKNIKEAAALHFQERVEKGEALRIAIVAEAEVRPEKKKS